MTRLKEKYLKEVVPKLQEEFGIKNVLAVPKVSKIVINVGVGDAKVNPASLEKVTVNLTSLSGQRPVTTRAKKSIAAFKIAKGDPIGVMVTIRGNRMYEFLDKLISVVLPKVRDFRGVSNTSFDQKGNPTLGLKEQAIFPEVAFEGTKERMRGLEISIITTAQNQQQGRRLLELLGMPFKKESK